MTLSHEVLGKTIMLVDTTGSIRACKVIQKEEFWRNTHCVRIGSSLKFGRSHDEVGRSKNNEAEFCRDIGGITENPATK